MSKKIKTPRYWYKPSLYKEHIEVETAYGNKVLIPKAFSDAWEMCKLQKAALEKSGLYVLDGLESRGFDVELVFYERYKEEN